MDLGHLFFEVGSCVFDGLKFMKLVVESASQFYDHGDCLFQAAGLFQSFLISIYLFQAANEWFWGGLELEFEKADLDFQGFLSEGGNVKIFVDEGVFDFMEIEAVMGRKFLFKENVRGKGTNEEIDAEVVECESELGMLIFEGEGGGH